MKSIFTERDVQYSLKSKNHLHLPNAKTAKYGIENIPYIGHNLWASLPEEIKDSDTLTVFKQNINCGKEVLATADCAKFLLLDLSWNSILYILYIIFAIDLWFEFCMRIFGDEMKASRI